MRHQARLLELDCHCWEARSAAINSRGSPLQPPRLRPIHWQEPLFHRSLLFVAYQPGGPSRHRGTNIRETHVLLFEDTHGNCGTQPFRRRDDSSLRHVG